MKKISILILFLTFFSLFVLSKEVGKNYDRIKDISIFVVKVVGRGVISDKLNGKNLIVNNMPVLKGDEISVKKGSYVELMDSLGNVYRIGGLKSKVKFYLMDSKRVEVKLKKGNIFVNKNTNSLLLIKCDNGIVASTGGNRFLVESSKGKNNVYCFVGPVLLKTKGVEKRLYEPKSAEISRNRIRIFKTNDYENNPLYRWSDKRDSERNNKISMRYLAFRDVNPVILYELSHYGNWVKHPRWGYVWVPNKIPSDWHPYSYGRWYGVGRDTNMVWISAEPWGYVYYCGSWAYDSEYGWVLIPSRMNRPMFDMAKDVCWFFDGDYVFWMWKGFLKNYERTQFKISRNYVSGMRLRDFLRGKIANKNRVKNSLRRFSVSKISPSKLIFNERELFRRISNSNFVRRNHYGGYFSPSIGKGSSGVGAGSGSAGGFRGSFHGSTGTGNVGRRGPKKN